MRNVGPMTVTTPGAVIDGLNISGALNIAASNVTVTRTRVTASDYFVIRIMDGVTGTKISNVEVNGLGLSGADGSMGIYGLASVSRSNIYGVENGLAPDSGSVLQDNYVHDLAAPGAAHYDGIQIDGGISNVTISHNTVLNGYDQTSALMIDNGFGPINNISVTNNRLGGGGYTIYSDGQFNNGAITGVSFVNNRLRKGYWGYVVVRNCSVTWTGNVDDTTSQTVGD